MGPKKRKPRFLEKAQWSQSEIENVEEEEVKRVRDNKKVMF